MYQTLAICDVCARTKQLANHWYLLARDDFQSGIGFELAPWTDQYAQSTNPVLLFLCSAECVSKMLNKFLERK